MNPAVRPPDPAPRLLVIDAVRGFAVLGILLMNIVALAMPVYAYVDPFYYGGTTRADLVAWALAYVFADAKMRALFTLLFGASLLLIADRAERPAWLHYRRMAMLLLIGMAHAWLLWFGDILVEYAMVGAIAFVGRNWRPVPLLVVTALCFALALADDLLAWQQLAALKAAAFAPGAPPAAVAGWQAVLAATTPQPAAIAHEIALYRGGFAEVMTARTPTTLMFQIRLIPLSLPETLGYVSLGMALYRLGALTGEWRRGRYVALVAAGAVAALGHVPVARLLLATRFDPATIPLADALSFLLRPWLALGYFAAIVLLVCGGRLRGAVERLAATGRMALSNYIGTTLIATTLFYGYGAGLYGRLDRAELYLVVLGIWAVLLFASPAWLARFAYGPLEWLWRATSRGELPPFRHKQAIATYSHQK